MAMPVGGIDVPIRVNDEDIERLRRVEMLLTQIDMRISRVNREVEKAKAQGIPIEQLLQPALASDGEGGSSV